MTFGKEDRILNKNFQQAYTLPESVQDDFKTKSGISDSSTSC